MALIQTLTMKSLCEQALELTKKKVRLSNCPITMPNPYNVDITSANIQTQFEIQYTSPGTRNRPGMHAVIYLTGDTPKELRGTLSKDVIAFNITCSNTDKMAYERMLTICQELADNILAVIKQNQTVIRNNDTLTITRRVNDVTYMVQLQDIMVRRNCWKRCTQSGIPLQSEPIPKSELLGCLTAARDKYRYILTPRKLERLTILIGELTGQYPTFKQRQKMLREQKNT